MWGEVGRRILSKWKLKKANESDFCEEKGKRKDGTNKSCMHIDGSLQIAAESGLCMSINSVEYIYFWINLFIYFASACICQQFNAIARIGDCPITTPNL